MTTSPFEAIFYLGQAGFLVLTGKAVVRDPLTRGDMRVPTFTGHLEKAPLLKPGELPLERVFFPFKRVVQDGLLVFG